MGAKFSNGTYAKLCTIGALRVNLHINKSNMIHDGLLNAAIHYVDDSVLRKKLLSLDSYNREDIIEELEKEEYKPNENEPPEVSDISSSDDEDVDVSTTIASSSRRNLTKENKYGEQNSICILFSSKIN